MTTYPLSERATIYAGDSDTPSDAIGQGTLEECAQIVAGFATEKQKGASIRMDDLDLTFGPKDVGALLQFLREESSGLSNNEIAEIKDPGA